MPLATEGRKAWLHSVPGNPQKKRAPVKGALIGDVHLQ
jgi:hypothetical protein